MKLAFLAFVFILLSIHAKAHTLSGQVKLFFGRSVETGQLYSYHALMTDDEERLLLPDWIDAKLIGLIGNHDIHIEGSIQYLACTDMSEACPTGEIKKVRWLQFQQDTSTSREEIFTGLLKRFHGRRIESNETYDYIALATGEKRVQMPLFLNLDKLMKLNPQITMFGTVSDLVCTDMSEACGPAQLTTLRMLKLNF